MGQGGVSSRGCRGCRGPSSTPVASRMDLGKDRFFEFCAVTPKSNQMKEEASRRRSQHKGHLADTDDSKPVITARPAVVTRGIHFTKGTWPTPYAKLHSKSYGPYATISIPQNTRNGDSAQDGRAMQLYAL